MSYYRYVKKPVKIPGLKPPRWRRLLSPILITVGSLMLANVSWPIIYYQVFTAPALQKTEFVSPVPVSQLGNAAYLSQNLVPTPVNPQVLGVDLDYTNPTVWFPSAQYGLPGTGNSYYKISIPDVNIEDAEVVVGGTNLDKSLIQYPNTALPGQLGSPVIFGHSILRQFYDPAIENPHRYISIFSKIMTLKNGSKVFIDFDGIRYTYVVKDKFEVKPEDVFILEQKYTQKELKLITCVPEGTYLRRGVVIAGLMDLE